MCYEDSDNFATTSGQAKMGERCVIPCLILTIEVHLKIVDPFLAVSHFANFVSNNCTIKESIFLINFYLMVLEYERILIRGFSIINFFEIIV